VEERNETIAQKESRIFEIKQKNQELEKFRFVLEYKINELREELEPQELTIAGKERVILFNYLFNFNHKHSKK
jgi:cilia- and flagella-associated protein 57